MGKKTLAILLAATLCIMSGCGSQEEKMEAVSMRLQRTAGKVSLWDVKGQEQSLLEQMRLIVGNVLGTEKESLAQVSLDETRMVTMEEKSKVSIDSAGKNQVINVKEGNAFFNISEKVKEGDSLKIRVGNIICGITGTSLQAGVDPDGNETILVTDGNIEVIETGGQSGATKKANVSAGNKITVVREGGSGTTSFKQDTFSEEDLSPTSLYAIGRDSSLKERVTESSGFSGDKLEKLAEVTSVKGSAGEEALPLTGTSASLITSAVKEAFKTAGNDLALEMAIITGVRESLDTGVKAGFNDDALTKLTTTTSEILNNLAGTGLDKKVNSSDLVQMVGSISGTITESAAALVQSGMASNEVNNVVDAIGKKYDSVISQATGNDINMSMLSAVTASQISQTISAQVARNANGDQTAQAVIGNITANQTAAAPAPQGIQQQAAPAPARADTAEVNRESDNDDDDSYSGGSSSDSGASGDSAPVVGTTETPSQGTRGDRLPVNITDELKSKMIITATSFFNTDSVVAYYDDFTSYENYEIAYKHLRAQLGSSAGGKLLRMFWIEVPRADEGEPVVFQYVDASIKAGNGIVIWSYDTRSHLWDNTSVAVDSVSNGFVIFKIKTNRLTPMVIVRKTN